MSFKLTRSIGKNHSPRSKYGHGSKIKSITIHHWGSTGQKFENVVSWLRGYTGNNGSSAHYVAQDGRVTQIVEDSRASWHGGNNEANGTSIGIEMRPEMTQGDWETLVELCVLLERRHGSLKYYGHKDWKNTACPGKYYDRLGELVDAVNEYHKTGKVPKTTNGGSSSGGGTAKKYKEVEYGTTLGLYDKGAPVKEWQREALGYSDDDADGYFGPQTEADTEDWQAARGLTPDGLVGEKTWDAYKDGAKPSKPKPKDKTPVGKIYDFPYEEGGYIGPLDGPDRSHSGIGNRKTGGVLDCTWNKRFVDRLEWRGWDPEGDYLVKYGNDGKYGDELESLIRAFQEDQGLVVDGLAGRETWDAAFKNPVT